MVQAAIDGSLLGTDSTVTVTSSWSTLSRSPVHYTAPTNVFFNATYLFSSESLEVDEVVAAVRASKNSAHVRRLLFVYANADTEVSGKKFRKFKNKMKGEFRGAGEEKQSIRYLKKRSSNLPVTATFVRQLLVFKGDV